MSVEFNDGVLQGYTEFEPGELHVHIYGTNQPEDVAADFLALKWFWKGMFVHAGFSIYASKLLRLWKSWGVPAGVRVTLSGHSMGAGVATIFGAYLRRKGCNVRVVVCGSPKVGGALFAWQARRLLVTRYEVEGDPITMLPPAGYCHVGCCVRIPWEGSDDAASLYTRHQPAAYQAKFPYQL